VIFRIAGLVSLCTALFAAQPSSILLSNRDGSNQALASIGRVQATFTCTGAWIEPPSGAPGDAPAYVLTSGHCISLDPWAVIANREASFPVTFNFFADTRDSVIALRTTRIMWSTMRGIDLALLELNATNDDLRARGLTPHKLQGSLAGTNLHWAGAPTGFIPTGQAYLRKGTCNALGTTTVIEARWLWYDQIRNDCPELYPSASGSPLFDSVTNAIVGVIGTSTLLSTESGGDYDCYQSRPCAVTNAGPLAEQDLSYASPVAPLLQCFHTSGRLDTGVPGCALPAGSETFTVDTQRVTAVKPGGRWNVRVNGIASYFWKQTGIGGSCRAADGYAPSSGATIDAVLPEVEGHYLLCVAASLDSLRYPLIVRYKVDSTPLESLPVYDVVDTGLAYRVIFYQQAPATGGMEFKRGRLSDVQCEDPAGYRTLFSVPPVIFRTECPHRLCVRMQDEAGNLSAPLQYDFGPAALQPFGIRNSASLQRVREVARGSRFILEGIELDASALRGTLKDAAGLEHPVVLDGSESTWREGYLPPTAALGSAVLTLAPGGLAMPLQVTQLSPGMYTANYTGFTPARLYYQKPGSDPAPAFDCGLILCTDLPIPVSTGETLDLLLTGTGMSGGSLTVSLGGEPLQVIEANPNADHPGVDNLRVRLPGGFHLRGYQLLRAGNHFLRVILE
jgi:hypothetical protein